MKYHRDPADNGVFSRKYIPNSKHVVEFRALKLAQFGKTIIHIIHEQPSGERQVIGTHRFDVDNGKERLWLGNHAHGNLNGIGGDLTKTVMGMNLTEFTTGLFDYDSATITSELVKGDPSWKPKFLAFPHIIEGGMTIMAGAPGSTKSSTGIALAISVDSGVDKLWPVQQSGPALLINMERSKQSIAGRIGHINHALGWHGERELEVFHTQGRTLLQVEATLRRIVSEKGVYVAVLDSLSRTGLGNLNDNADANAVMNMMTELFPTSLVLAHSSKDKESKGTFGSVMFQAAADVEINVETHRIGQENTSWTEYQILKANDLGVRSKSWFAFEYIDQYDEDDSRIRTSRLSDIRIPDQMEIPDFGAEQHLTPLEKIIRALNDHGNLHVNDIADLTEIKANTVRSTLNRKKGSTFTRNEDETWTLLGPEGRPI
jgi:hypothetical protein|tara:strand:+ start:87 stop:1379 length:1293 start_codon:yes stop_codon:yes gene_type:complete